MNSKGQGSLEFLMTYGWAVIIIAVALVLLWQWGVFNPTGNTQQTYLGFWGVVPIDISYKTDGSIILSLQNNIVDGDVNITDIVVRHGGLIMSQNYGDYGVFVESGTRHEVNVAGDDPGNDLPGGADGATYDLAVEIRYLDNRLNRTLYPDDFQSAGNIQGSIEKI